jgi:hypothetical protein
VYIELLKQAVEGVVDEGGWREYLEKTAREVRMGKVDLFACLKLLRN